MEKTERKLKGVEKELVDVGLKARLRVETGMPVREILRVEDEENVSVTVIGSHGRSNLEEIFLGCDSFRYPACCSIFCRCGVNGTGKKQLPAVNQLG